MIPLSQRLEELEYVDIAAWTAAALDLHDYQHHRPDPDMALSKYRNRQEADLSVVGLVEAVVKYAEALKSKARRTEGQEKASIEVKKRLD